MIVPSYAKLQTLAQEYPVAPVSKEIYADVVTPITLLRRMANLSDRYFLLESIEGGERWGRYSFLGFDPKLRATLQDGVVTLEEDGRQRIMEGDPLDVLRGLLAQYRAPKLPELPPFTGGLVGTFNYEMIAHAEPTLRLKRAGTPDFDLMLFDKVIAYDHLKQKITVIVNLMTSDLGEHYGAAISAIERIIRLITAPLPLPRTRVKGRPRFAANVSRADFCQMVETLQRHIRAGDIFQAVPSLRQDAAYADSLLSAYRVLRTTNPSPYMVFLSNGEMELMSASPETLVRVQDGTLTTFPVAGTRPRGATIEEDAALEQELLADPKELSEHNMLLDLARNDLGRVADFGSVRVTGYQEVHRYSKVMHLASVVEGRLRADRDALDALMAVLPAGTLSGAPKIRACQLIDEVEADPRGIYGGAIGYLDLTGNLDACIAIRTAVKRDGRVSVQAGAGVVADSVPEREYEECSNKAMALIQAIEAAAEVEDE